MSSRVALASICVASGTLLSLLACWGIVRRRHLPAALPFVAMVGLGAAWVWLHLGEALATTLHEKLAWDCAQYPPYAAQAGAALWLGFSYAQGTPRPRFMWPLAFVLLALSGYLALAPWLGSSLREDARLRGELPELEYSFGAADALLALLVIGCWLAACIKVLAGLGQEHRLYVPQRVMLGVALGFPVLATLFGMALQLRLFGDRDLSPVTLALGGVATGWALGKGRVFSVMPVGRGALLEHLHDGVFVLDKNNRLVDINPSGARLLGAQDSEALLGAHATAAFAHWESLGKLVATFEEGKREAPALEAPDGSRHDVTIAPLNDSLGTAVGHTVLLRNVTRPVQALALSEGRFAALFDQTFQSVVLLSEEGRVKAANAAALCLVGLSAEEVAGKLLWDTPWWVEADPSDELKRHFIEAKTGHFVRFELQRGRKGGAFAALDVSLKPTVSSGEAVQEVILEARDVSVLRQEQERNLKLAEELRQAQKMEAIGRLAGGVAHDFNNLLTAVKLNAEVALGALASGKGEPHLKGPLRGIMEAANAATDITGQLLAFAGKRGLSREPVDLPELLRSMRSFLDPLLGQKARIEVTHEAGLWQAYVDRSQTRQAVLNLVVNARDAMPSGGVIGIACSNRRIEPSQLAPDQKAKAGDFVCLEVSDSGEGMPTEVLEKLFEPFFTTKPEGKGTGLGLAVVHGVVERSGGFVQVSSKLGRGTTFRLYLPRATEPTAAAG